MGYTLTERLNGVNRLEESEALTGIRVVRNFNAERRRIIGEFMGGQPIVKGVYNGDDSFVERIDPVLQRYKGFRNHFWQGLDTEFDNSTKQTIEAMNSIGSRIARPYDFTTASRREKTKEVAKYLLVAPIITGCLGVAVVASFGGQNVALGFGAGAGAAWPITVSSYRHSNLMKENLEELRTTAQTHDRYLGRLFREFGKV